MKILLITNNHNLYSSKRLREEATLVGIEHSIQAPNNGLLHLTQKKKLEQMVVLHRSTGMLYDDFDLLISQQLHDAGVPIINPLSVIKKYRDKELQAYEFTKVNLPTIPTISLRGKITLGHLESIQALGNSEQFILKTVRGNQGIGVNLINGVDSLNSLLETFWALGDQRFIVQPFIKTEREYRVLFCGNKILGSIEKIGSKGEFRKNAKRSPATFLKEQDLPSEVHELALKTYTESKSIMSGIDIIQTKDGLYLLEINMVPGFEQMEKLSGQNIAKEFILTATEKTK